MGRYRLSSESPEQSLIHENFLLYSKCSGYMLAKACFEPNGKFETFISSMAGVIVPIFPEDFEAWIVLDRQPAQVVI
ncbi:hypothetical protein [Izhakiella australiensis]|uniref:hypothetical protein n=1 Tax=Izhakiella australiensis TaxID=1926881 RepID=UPI0011158C44|nr:hypothetical protein [Izhakiella australiensis]